MSSRERNYGIDALRLVSMYMVVVLHILGCGGILQNESAGTGVHIASWIMEHAALVSVNCFALISGYVGLYNKHKLSGLIMQWIQVFTYSAGIMLLLFLLIPEWVSGEEMLHALLPVGYGEYWYFTAYCGSFLFMPLMNAAVQNQNRPQFILSGAGVLFLFVLYPTLIDNNPFQFNKGYSTIWLIILYYIGAGIRKHIVIPKKAVPVCLLVYVGSVLLHWLQNEVQGLKAVSSLHYDNILNVSASIALFLAFTVLQPKGITKKLIQSSASLAFAVYLIHTHPLIFVKMLAERFRSFAGYPVPAMIGAVLGFAALIFMICILIEWCRAKSVQFLQLKQIVEKAAQKVSAAIQKQISKKQKSKAE